MGAEGARILRVQKPCRWQVVVLVNGQRVFQGHKHDACQKVRQWQGQGEIVVLRSILTQWEDYDELQLQESRHAEALTAPFNQQQAR